MLFHLDKERIAVAVWNTDDKKLIAICNSWYSTSIYLFGNNSDKNLSTVRRYATITKKILPAKKNILGLNIKIKPANIDQVKLLKKEITIL